MNNYIGKFNLGLVIILTTTLTTIARPQPASAQILEIAAGALNALIRSKQPPQPQVIQQPVPVPVPTQPNGPEFNVGTNNGNGNTLNLCVSNCLPTGAPSTLNGVYQPPVPATIVQQRPVVQQQGVSTSTSATVVQQNGGVGTTSIQTTQQSAAGSVQ